MKPTQAQIEELRTEGKIAADKGMRIGHYCLEAADTIERLTAAAEVGPKSKCIAEHMGGKRCVGRCMDPKDCIGDPLPVAAEAGYDLELDDITIRMQLERIKQLEDELAAAEVGLTNPPRAEGQQIEPMEWHRRKAVAITIERCAQVAEAQVTPTRDWPKHIAAAIRKLKDEA